MNLRRRDATLSRLASVAWPEAPLLDRLRLCPTADVLDVGAGDGRLLAALRRRGHRGRRVGLDPRPGPGVLPARAEDLPFADAGFDVVLLVRVLAHLADPEGALAEARRVVGSGARFMWRSRERRISPGPGRRWGGRWGPQRCRNPAGGTSSFHSRSAPRTRGPSPRATGWRPQCRMRAPFRCGTGCICGWSWSDAVAESVARKTRN